MPNVLIITEVSKVLMISLLQKLANQDIKLMFNNKRMKKSWQLMHQWQLKDAIPKELFFQKWEEDLLKYL